MRCISFCYSISAWSGRDVGKGQVYVRQAALSTDLGHFCEHPLSRTVLFQHAAVSKALVRLSGRKSLLAQAYEIDHRVNKDALTCGEQCGCNQHDRETCAES